MQRAVSLADTGYMFYIVAVIGVPFGRCKGTRVLRGDNTSKQRFAAVYRAWDV